MKELTQEQIDTLGFEPTEAESDYVDAMAATVISDLKSKAAFEGQRNRTAHNRMNRPHKAIQHDVGAKKIFALLDRFKCRTTTGNEDTGEGEITEDSKVANSFTGV